MGNLIDWVVSGDDDDEFDELYDSDSDSGDFPFSNIELTTCHKYDCVLVFDEGSRIEEWKYSQYSSIQYDYLNLLDASLISERKSRFPHHGANFGCSYDRITVRDFNKNERKLVIRALKKLDIKCKSIHSLNRQNELNHRYYYVGMSETRCRKWAHKIGYNLEIEPESATTYLALLDENLAKATIDNDDQTKLAVKCSFWNNVYIKFFIYYLKKIIHPQKNRIFCFQHSSDLLLHHRVSLLHLIP